MLRRIWYFLTDSRNLTILGFVALAVFLYLGAEVLEVALIWALAQLFPAITNPAREEAPPEVIPMVSPYARQR